MIRNLQIQSDLLNEVVDAHRYIRAHLDDSDVITRVLEHVGSVAGVDRVYIFETRFTDGGEVLASQRFEWCSPNVDAQIDNPELQDIPLTESGYGRWVDRFLAYRPVFGLVENLPESERVLLEMQGIRSILVLPIYAEAELWGFVGFDDCSNGRDWSVSDVDILLSLAISLGAVIAPVSPALSDEPPFQQLSETETVSSYAAMAGSLAWPETSDEAGHASAVSPQLIEARLRSLVRTHRYFQSRPAYEDVDIVDFLRSLEDHFGLITRQYSAITVVHPAAAECILTGPEPALILGLLISEKLCTLEIEEPGATILISASCKPGRRVLHVRGFDHEGRRVRLAGKHIVSSALFQRRLIDKLDGSVMLKFDDEE